VIDGAEAVGSVLRRAAEVLAAGAVPDPRREAARLWSAMEEEAALLDRNLVLDAARAERYLAAVRRRAAGEPLAYVAGRCGFRRLELHCDRRALIPRPETETVVEVALARCRTGRAADIGTGTGAIALALRDEGDFDRVVGSDVSGDALALARENGERAGLAVEWRLGDLLAPWAGDAFDLVVANPPYLSVADFALLDRSVRDYEPAGALVSGPDGLDATRRLVDAGRAAVAAGGWLVLEVDTRRAGVVAELAAAAGWRDVSVQEDLFGRARVVSARQGSRG
jgi:release factor glutamine methyltransferase